MLLTANPEETYCLKTQEHVPATVGENVVCYRCGMFLSRAEEQGLGTLLDF
jgi:hypothetical protein